MRQTDAVLFVEDFVRGREYVANALRAKGYTVLEAGTVREAEDAIDKATQEPEGAQVPLRIGAIILDGHFPYGDERDERENTNDHGPARAVVDYMKAHGLGRVSFIGFSSEPMERQAIGLGDDDEGSFTDVGKYNGGPKEILEILAATE